MGIADTTFVHSSPMGGSTHIRRGRMTGSQTFNRGAWVQVVAAGTVTVFPEDGTPILCADQVDTEGGTFGLAMNGPGAASTAEFPNNFVKIHPDTGNAYVADDWIYFVQAIPGQLFRTSNILATGGATAETAASITGADRGAGFLLTYCNSTTPDLGWGVERTATSTGVVGSNVIQIYAKIWDVLDARGRSVTTTGVGTQYVFEVANTIRTA
jgi:hypothetical protein